MKFKKYVPLSFSAVIALSSLVSLGLGADVSANGTPQKDCTSSNNSSITSKRLHHK